MYRSFDGSAKREEYTHVHVYIDIKLTQERRKMGGLDRELNPVSYNILNPTIF
jgi:hypothetical protein